MPKLHSHPGHVIHHFSLSKRRFAASDGHVDQAQLHLTFPVVGPSVILYPVGLRVPRDAAATQVPQTLDEITYVTS